MDGIISVGWKKVLVGKSLKNISNEVAVLRSYYFRDIPEAQSLKPETCFIRLSFMV